MMSMVKLKVGTAHEYLMRTVAKNDIVGKATPQDVASYHSGGGDSPGVWWGAGVAGLVVPELEGGVHSGGLVTEANMLALFGEGRHPDAVAWEAALQDQGMSAEQIVRQVALGRGFRQGGTHSLNEHFNRARQAARAAEAQGEPFRSDADIMRELFVQHHEREPLDAQELYCFQTMVARESHAVAGYDLTFTPQKSVSVLWAVGDDHTRQIIEQAHQRAVEESLVYVQEHVACARRGNGGFRQVDVQGLVAAQFFHRDSRSGDPNMHTHVAVANRVQDATDGTWLTLDGRLVHRHAVAASESYNTAIQRELTAVGLSFVERVTKAGAEPVMEVEGVPHQLCDQWSSRREEVEAEVARQELAFKDMYGRTPTVQESREMAQQATLVTRPAKHIPPDRDAQRSKWQRQAEAFGVGPDTFGRLTQGRGNQPIFVSAEQRDAATTTIVADVLAALAREKSTWTIANIDAEIQRQFRHHEQVVTSSTDLMLQVRARVTAECQELGPARVDTPAAFQNRRGESVYVVQGLQKYTHQSVVDAEARIIDAAGRDGGRRVQQTTVAAALARSSAKGITLNAGQEALVQRMGTSGRRVEVALAAAGTGKTTAVEVLADAWRSEGGTVLATATAATAAAELGEAMGSEHVTLAQLRIDLDSGQRIGESVDDRTMVVIDEASMATTNDLDAVIGAVVAQGGVVRLLGDDRQLSAIGAGGVVTDIARVHGAISLSEAMRFNDPAEAAAAESLRAGDVAALGFYADHGRIGVGTAATARQDVFDRWAQDHDGGKRSLMLAFTRADVGQLNQLAQAHVHAGGEYCGPRATLCDGATVQVGDTIVTRRNDQSLRCGRSDAVRNGYRWIVRGITEDGNVVAQKLGSRDQAVLPAAYVSEHVQHGWAMTVHTAQGQTSETSHILADARTTHQLLYVGLSRGKQCNTVTVVVPEPDEHLGDIAAELVTPQTAMEILGQIVRQRPESVQSAHTADAEVSCPEAVLAQAARTWQDAVGHGAEALCGSEYVQWLRDAVEVVDQRLVHSDGWPHLRQQLAVIALQRDEPIAALQEVLNDGLGDCHDVAAVAAWRLDAHIKGENRPLSWMRTVPEVLAQHPEYEEFFAGLADQIVMSTEAIGWDEETVPPVVHGHGLSKHPELARQVHLWRVAHGVPDHDIDPMLGMATVTTGDDALYRRQIVQTYRTIVEQREELVPDEVQDKLRGDGSYHRFLARIEQLADQGHDTHTLLDKAVAQGPLPAEQPAAAVWWRMQNYQVRDQRASWTFRPPATRTPMQSALPHGSVAERKPMTPEV